MLPTLDTGTRLRAGVCEDGSRPAACCTARRVGRARKSPLWLRVGEHREQSSSGEGKSEVSLSLHKAPGFCPWVQHLAPKPKGAEAPRSRYPGGATPLLPGLWPHGPAQLAISIFLFFLPR